MASDQEKTRSNYMVPSSTEGYSCFSDQTTTHLVRQLQSFQYQHQSNSPTQLYTLNTTMEMLNFPPNTKNLETNSVFWKGFYDGKATGDNHHHDGGGSSSSSKAGVAINEPPRSHDFYQDDEFNTKGSSFTSESNFMQVDNRLLVEDQHDPSNMRSYHVFPCGANERPSQGLSLSLSSNNPSTIGLQSFELRHDQDHHDQMRLDHIPSSSSRDHEFFGPKSMMQYHQHQESTSQFQIESSKYLAPAQELLNEFCSLGTSHNHHLESKIQNKQKFNQWNQEDDDQNIAATSSSFNKHSLYSLEFLELQKRKAKLLQMLEEVDRRYKHYCDQMKGVVCSFEAGAGSGTATVYSALVSKTMSKHFRCLRDGIVGEIKATKKAMGDKDTASPGGTRGETPRLRVLDQTLRQQRAFQQMNMMETHPWRPQRGLPERSVTVLRAWLFEHFLHPYPSDVDKHILSRQTGLSRSQVSNWFINARVRLWKPMVEEMYLEETKEHENNINSPDHGFTNLDEDNASHLFNHINSQQLQTEDKKPTQDHLVRIDSECLSSIINHPDKNDTKHFQDHLHHHHHQPSSQHHSFSRISDTFGAVELDFASYNHQNNFSSTADHRGVSLTLGLQQNRGMAFSSTSQTSLNHYPRDEIEDCQQVQYSSLLDAAEAQNLPYRNLMGAQLLHDLAG